MCIEAEVVGLRLEVLVGMFGPVLHQMTLCVKTFL